MGTKQRPTGTADTGEDAEVLLLGEGAVGAVLADRLGADRHVRYVDLGEENPFTAASAVEDDAGIGAILSTDLAVVYGGTDGRTLMLTQTLRTRFGLERVHAVLADPRNSDAFDIPGVRTICLTEALTDAVRAAGIGGSETDSSSERPR